MSGSGSRRNQHGHSTPGSGRRFRAPDGAKRRDRMETTCLIEAVEPLARVLKSRVIGQDEAIDSLICSFSRLIASLQDPSRPLLTALLLGPTGVGKT